MEIFGDDSGFVAWDQEILVAMEQDKILERELYEELPALAIAALRVSKLMTPGPETTVTSNLPNQLVPPVKLDATVLTGEGESPDSLGWAGSAVGSPELGD
jgi:hypothetical protein